jgi:regulator of RNase E activity RraB
MHVRYSTLNEENRPVIVETNLDFEPASDDTVWMLWAFAPLKNAEEAGGCSAPEWERLEGIKAALSDRLELRNGALYAGMRLQEGWAELYYYAAWSKGAEQQFRDVFKQHGYDHIEFGASRDTHQAFYHETLYPDAYELQQARSREIIEALAEAGDDLAAERAAEHYLFFQTDTAMRRAAAHLAEAGAVETGLEGEGRFPHGLALTLEHACTEAALADVTAPLIALAEKEHGFYMGWSTTLAQESGV